MIAAFKQGMATGPLSDSLIRNPAETFSEVRERAIAHIEAEEAVLRKNGCSHSRQPKPKESSRDRPQWVLETSAEKRTDSRCVPYVAKKDESRGKAREEPQAQPKFCVLQRALGYARSGRQVEVSPEDGAKPRVTKRCLVRVP